MPSSRMTALLGLLAVVGYQNRQKLSEAIGKVAGRNGGGLLESILGGASGGDRGNDAAKSSSQGGLLSGGLRELIDRFTNNGQGDVAKSWVGTGPNKNIDTAQLEHALGPETIDSLTKETGLSREELLRRLQTVLPAAVDKMTPDGQIPKDQ